VPLAQPGDLIYRTQFDPASAFPEGMSGEGGQTFTLEPSSRPGVWASVAWFPATRVGLETRVRFRSATVDGTSGPYEVSVTYVSRQPPDYVPREHTFERSRTWPDEAGTIRDVSLDVVIVGRLGDPSRLQVRPSGGLALVGISGDLEPIGLTTFRLGGHSVLFPFEHRVSVAFDRTWTVGAVGGVEVHRAVGGRAGLTVSARVVVPREIEAPARVTAVESDLDELAPDGAGRALDPPPLTYRPWTVELLGGIRVRF
jgi:hypothetical protein